MSQAPNSEVLESSSETLTLQTSGFLRDFGIRAIRQRGSFSENPVLHSQLPINGCAPLACTPGVSGQNGPRSSLR